MKLERPHIVAIVVLALLCLVAFFPTIASRAAGMMLSLIVLLIIFGLIPILWRDWRG